MTMNNILIHFLYFCCSNFVSLFISSIHNNNKKMVIDYFLILFVYFSNFSLYIYLSIYLYIFRSLSPKIDGPSQNRLQSALSFSLSWAFLTLHFASFYLLLTLPLSHSPPHYHTHYQTDSQLSISSIWINHLITLPQTLSIIMNIHKIVYCFFHLLPHSLFFSLTSLYLDSTSSIWFVN